MSTGRHVDARADAAAEDLDIAIRTKHVTAAEVAAVTAVLTEAMRELSADQAQTPMAPSAWQRSQKRLRAPIVPGPGAWRSFSA